MTDRGMKLGADNLYSLTGLILCASIDNLKDRKVESCFSPDCPQWKGDVPRVTKWLSMHLYQTHARFWKESLGHLPWTPRMTGHSI